MQRGHLLENLLFVPFFFFVFGCCIPSYKVGVKDGARAIIFTSVIAIRLSLAITRKNMTATFHHRYRSDAREGF